jgi:hypothetical protein
MDHVSKQTVITNNSQVFVWRGIGQLSAIQEDDGKKEKRIVRTAFNSWISCAPARKCTSTKSAVTCTASAQNKKSAGS